MHATASAPEGNLARLAVLYVEDDDEIREQLAQFLRRRVGRLYTAENGRQGLDAWHRYHPDIVVSDIRMPEMDGLEMADRIKNDSASAPIILTSAFSDTAYLLRSIDIGIDKYVLKPVRTEALETALHRVAQTVRTQSDLKLAATVFENVSEAILVADAHGRLIAANPAFERLTGRARDAALGCEVSALLDGESADAARAWTELGRTGTGRREITVTRKDRSTFTGWMSADTVRRPDGDPVYQVFVLADISERKAAEETLRRMNEALEARVRERTASLEQANRELESFSYSVSHDLRAPLRGIEGYTRLLEDGFSDRLDDLGRGHLQRIRSSTQRMQHLIDDLLALARVTRSGLHHRQCPISAMAKQIAAELRQHDAQRIVDWRIAPDLVAQADPHLLHIVLDNLLRNAWKFTGKTGLARIEFGAIEQDGERVFFVGDNGAGFDESQAQRLFQPFQRLHRASEFEGTGIGLAIVERIIRRHGGRVWARAVVGQGARFHFTLPDNGTAGQSNPAAHRG